MRTRKPSREGRRHSRGLEEEGGPSGNPTPPDWGRIEETEQNGNDGKLPAISPKKIIQEAERRAIYGIRVPLVSEGKVVRDDDGRPIATQQYSDELLQVLLRAHDPERFGPHQYPRRVRTLLTILVTIVAGWAAASIALRLLDIALPTH